MISFPYFELNAGCLSQSFKSGCDWLAALRSKSNRALVIPE